MALFHLSVTQTKRSAGQSAIASAAYRAGERLYSEYYGEYSDYTRKGGVICSDILLPSHAPHLIFLTLNFRFACSIKFILFAFKLAGGEQHFMLFADGKSTRDRRTSVARECSSLDGTK